MKITHAKTETLAQVQRWIYESRTERSIAIEPTRDGHLRLSGFDGTMDVATAIQSGLDLILQGRYILAEEHSRRMNRKRFSGK